MSKAMGSIYVARFGKVYGPFTGNEIEKFQASGKIHDYSWIWDPKKKEWKALDAAPPPLFEESEVPGVASKLHGKGASADRLAAICHDFRKVVRGMAAKMTETGCELVSEAKSISPAFAKKADVQLNLLDEKSGRQINVVARVCGVSKSRAGWGYQLRWQERPTV